MASQATLQFIVNMNAQQAQAVLQQLGGTFQTVGAQAATANAEIKGASASTRSLGSNLNSLLGPLGSISAAFAALKGITVFAQFERELDTFKAVAEVTGTDSAKQLQLVQQAAEDMARNSGVSVNAAAEALINFARAGYSLQDSISAAKATMDFAIISSTDFGNAAQITGSILHQFNLDATETSKVVDVLAEVDKDSAASASTLGESFAYAGGVAAQAGVSLNQLAAAIGILGNAGALGSRAGTELQDVIQRLTRITPLAAKTLKDMGVSIKDLPANDLLKTFTTLHNAGLDTAQSLVIFGQQGGRAAALLANSIPKFQEYIDKTKEAGGVAQEQARIINDNLVGSFNKMIGTAGALAIAIGQSGLTGGLTNLVNAFTSVLGTATTFFTNLSHAPAIVQAVTVAVTALTVAVAALVVVSQGAAIIAAIFAALASPIVLVVGAIGLVAGALYALRDNTVTWGGDTVKVGTVVYVIWQDIVHVIQQMVSWFGQATTAVVNWGNQHRDTLQFILNATITAVQIMLNLWIGFAKSWLDIITIGAQSVADVVARLVVGIGDKFSSISEAFQAAATGDWGKAGSIMGKALTTGIDLGISQDWDALMKKLSTNLQTDYVGGVVTAAKGALNSALGTVFDQAAAQGINASGSPDDRNHATDPNTNFPNANNPGTPINTSSGGAGNRQASFIKSLNDQIAKLQEQGAVLGLTTQQAQRYAAAQEIAQKALDAGIPDAQKYVDLYLQQYDALQKLQQAYQNNPINGIKKGIDDFSQSALKLADNIGTAFSQAFSDAADQMAAFVTTGKADFASLLQNLAQQLLSSEFKKLLADLFSGLNFGGSSGVSSWATPYTNVFSGGSSDSGGFLGSIGSAIAHLFHTGGVVGDTTNVRKVAASAFAGARRFHSGLNSDEFPAILQRGERVLTAQQDARVGNVLDALGSSNAGPGDMHFNITVNGARGNQEISDMVDAGITSALKRYSQAEPSRIQATVLEGKVFRRRGFGAR